MVTNAGYTPEVVVALSVLRWDSSSELEDDRGHGRQEDGDQRQRGDGKVELCEYVPYQPVVLFECVSSLTILVA